MISNRRIRDNFTFFIMVLPALAWFFGLMLWPIINMFYVSTLQWNGMLSPQVFVGLANYQRLLLDDPRFIEALTNTAIHWIVGMPIVIIPAFIFGFFLSLRLPGHRLFRIIFFSPVMMSAAGVTLMFMGIYMPHGIINSTLELVGLGALTRHWLADPSTALGAVILTDVWTAIGFQTMLFFATLSGIPRNLYEAAQIDGASYWQIIWRIAFPLSIDTFGVLMMLRTLWILIGSAQIVLLLTKGGPGFHSMTLGYYLFQQAFSSQKLGYSQAIAVFAFSLGMVMIAIIRRITRRSYLN